MNSRLKFLCSAVDSCHYTIPITSRYLCCELKRLSRWSGTAMKTSILEQSCDSCGCHNSCNRRVKMISRKERCCLRITCKLCGVTREKIISRRTAHLASHLITAQHKTTPRSRYHLKAAVILNKPRPVVNSPAITLKQFLYNDS